METKEETREDNQDVETKSKLPGNLVIMTGCLVIILIDDESTVTNSFPELKLGYENATEKRASQAPRSA